MRGTKNQIVANNSFTGSSGDRIRNCCPIVEFGSESAVLHTPDLAIALQMAAIKTGWQYLDNH